MKIQKEQIADYNQKGLESHNESFDFLASKLTKNGHDVKTIVWTFFFLWRTFKFRTKTR